MNPQFENLIKVRVSLKNLRSIPKGWTNFTESLYNNQKNFMLLTGKKNGIIVIDLDNKENKEVPVSVTWFESVFGKLESVDTLVTRSPNHGYHVFFKYTDKIKNTLSKKLNVDILSDNKCAFQGEGYPVLVDKPIRELTENEIKEIEKI
jgi:hypothetical protein